MSNESIEALSRHIDQDAGKLQDFLVNMLKINAVNPRMEGPGEEERADYIQNFLKSEGFDVVRVEANDDELSKKRPNLFAKLAGKDSNRTLWYIAHMDTVPEGSRELWNSDPFVPVVKDGKIVARGSIDNGQSLASAVFALRELKQLGSPLSFNVGLVCVADEEFGSNYGIKYLLEKDYFKQNDLIVVPDFGTPEGTSVEIAEKGLLWLKVIVEGKQVHASTPAKGSNAHRAGMRIALEVDELLHKKYKNKDQLFSEEKSSTFEPTKVEANVPNVNTIPGRDVLYFDCRVLPEYSLDNVLADVKSAASKASGGAKVSIEVVERDDAGPATSKDSEVVKLLSGAINRMTKKSELRFVGIGGQTVGNLFRRKGMSTAVWSTVDEVAHEPNEFCLRANLIADTKVFACAPLLAK
ncbi:MAG: M20 family metallo-hydrolase [Nitrososphaerota archaeon]|nr:M20 family metallo-hydrolase [Nitrososphaerota archaeon]